MIKTNCFVVGYLQTNCYVVSSDVDNNAVIIDAGGGFKKINEYLIKENKLPVALLCTHGHFDHVLDAKKWEDAGVKIYLHPADRELFYEEEETFPGTKLNYDKAKEVIFVSDGEKLEFGEISFTVKHTPGHTKGSVCYIGKNEIFSGDTVFFHSFGRTDLPGGDFGEIADSVNLILNTNEDKIIYPGHGECTTIKVERLFNPLYNR